MKLILSIRKALIIYPSIVWSIRSNIFIKDITLRLGKYNSPQFSSVSQSCPTLCDPMVTAPQASLSITNSWNLPKLMSIELVMPFNQLILCRPPLLQSFPVSGSFPMSQFLASGGQNIGVSASTSVLPMNTQN